METIDFATTRRQHSTCLPDNHRQPSDQATENQTFNLLGTAILLKKWPNSSMKSILANTECTIYARKDPTKRTIFWAAPWKGS